MSEDRLDDRSGSSDFAHLHLHSQYSLLDGAIRMRELCPAVLQRGMKSVAVTDHGNLFGAIQFFKEAKSHGVKPIFGAEMYVAEGEAAARSDRKNYHLVLLAQNEVGYQNLQRLVSFGHLRGFYYQPRIDLSMLAEHHEGLIATTSCLGGQIPRLLLQGQADKAREVALRYKEILGPRNFFFELQPNKKPDQEQINAALAQLGEDLDIPLIATNNVHYLERNEAHAHEVLNCMGLGRTFDDPNRPRRNTQELYLKTPEEMENYFRSRYPSALDNACEVAARCEVELKLGSPELPDFQIPEGAADNLEEYLRVVVAEGLSQRIAELSARGVEVDQARYRKRVEYELGIIISMKFPGYFLIVWDFIRRAKELGIPVGPGRGSGAGSLVAYSLRITDLDPMQYNLLFERFLNPERVSMPDFDIDFCMHRREEVIRYVTERYGEDRVGQIATFHSLKARGLLRDVCRVMGVSVAAANDLAKCIPEGPKVSLSMCLKDPAQIQAKIKKDPGLAKKYEEALAVAQASAKLRDKAGEDQQIAEILEIGAKLEGLYRHAGMHAAGVVIGNRALWEHVPCFAADGRIVTQFTMNDVEQAGLVKFDFLGLKTLTVIQAAVVLVNQLRPADDPFDLDAIPMDDPGVFEMISRGDTTGVFQLESSGFKELLKKLKPDCFEDIIAAVALYRPGPLEGGMVDQFIECKHGRREIEYPHPLLEELLHETYGVFVYQEQVMQAGQILAGFSLGAADLMRRAMGKKKKAEMDRQRALFVEGCTQHNQIPESTSNEIFDLIDKFAGYGFNKSHSAAYGLITYQTAYLKHHYPSAFMAGLMTCDKDKIDNVVKFVAEARIMGLEVLGPCVNESLADFSLVVRETGKPPAIRFGLEAVRNVGEGAVESIVAARREEGVFAHVFDLCRRVDLKRANRRTLENLVLSGAMDAIAEGRDRATLMATIPKAVEQGQSSARDRASGQGGLFDVVADASTMYDDSYPDTPAWSSKDTLKNEREVLGFYLTGHPLDRYVQEIQKHASSATAHLQPEWIQKEVTVGGVISERRAVVTKTGKAMCFFQLEDQFGRVEVVVFPKAFARPLDDEYQGQGDNLGDWIMSLDDEAILVSGKLEGERNEEGEVGRYKILADRVQTIVEVRRSHTQAICLQLDLRPRASDSGDKAFACRDEELLALAKVLQSYPGDCPVDLQVEAQAYQMQMRAGDAFRVSLCDALIDDIERLLGPGVLSFVSAHSDEPKVVASPKEPARAGRRRPARVG